MHAGNDGTAESGSPSSVGSATARQVHDDIERTLGAAPGPNTWSRQVGSLKTQGQRAWRAMKRHPFLSVVAVAFVATAVADEVGVGELAFGAVVAFAAYKVLREGEPPLRALEEIERDVRV
jgi:hypothetical protein